MKCLRLSCIALFIVIAGMARQGQAQTTATFTYPTNGATKVDTSKPFQWTTVSGAQAYYLYVGSAQGGKDLADSGAIQQTSYVVPPLPSNQKLYGRIWTKSSSTGVWTYSDITFTANPGKATFLYPTDGATNVTNAKLFKWTSVPGAEGYYLKIGTTPGAQDLVNTGALGPTQTSYQVPPLPVGQTLRGRIFTKLNGAWSAYQDISFTAGIGTAIFTYPKNGATNADISKLFQWTSVPGAEGYYLKIGTTPGAQDLVNTGALGPTQTSYQVRPLPSGQTLWARIYTKAENSWVRYSDISFTAAPQRAILTYPQNGAQTVDTSKPFTWTSAPDAQGYYLYVGTTQGGKDLVNTGEIQQTSHLAPPLPVGQTLWARIYTKLNGSWAASPDISFMADAGIPRFTTPRVSGQFVDTSKPFAWTSVPNAQAYYLYVGTTPGAKDLVDTGEIQQTSYFASPLPIGQTLHARIWAKSNNLWKYSDTTFTAVLAFIHPVHGAVNIDPTRDFEWPSAAVINGVAPQYYLYVGTSFGASDLVKTAALQQTSYTVPVSSLPPGQTLYARVRVRLGDRTWVMADSVFTVAGTSVTSPQMIYPTDGQADVDVSRPFIWSATDLAQAYQLQILDGDAIVHDSGLIHVNRYFIEDLALGSYVGRLRTQIAGQWHVNDVSFTVVHNGPDPALQMESAQWATDLVRNMADDENYPFTGTPLSTDLIARGRSHAFCSDYAATLVNVLMEMKVTKLKTAGQQPRVLYVAFNNNKYDTHTLVEWYNEPDQNWTLLDPTFSMVMKRASDGRWATKEDMQNATLAKDWSAISYVFLGKYGDAIARDYVLDYPLLFLNIPPLPVLGTGHDPLPYLQNIGAPPINQYGNYVFQSSQTPITVIMDGETRVVDCNGVQSLSYIQDGTKTITLPAGSTAQVQVYKARRFVF